MITESAISCGVVEMYDLEDGPKSLIRDASTKYAEGREWGEKFVHIIFSDAVRRGHGSKLAAVITKENLGALYTTRARKNPNSPNNIKTWMWSVNWDAVEKYLK